MRKRTRTSLLLVSVLFISFLAGSLASGAANISRSPNWITWSPRIVVDSAGNLHVVYAEYYTSHRDSPEGTGDAFYCKYDIGTSQWGNPVNLSNSRKVYSTEYRPVGIDIDNSDKLYVVYQEDIKVYLRIFSGGSWGTPIDIATNDDEVDSLRVAVDINGNIFICWWTTGKGRVYSRARIGGTWEEVKVLSLVGKRSKFPNIAVGTNVIGCTWQGSGGAGYQIMYCERSNSLNASWSQPQAVAPSQYTQQVSDLEIEPSDTVHLVYTPLVVSGGSRIVLYTRKSPGGNFSTPLQISEQRLLHYPSIFDRGGNLYVVWQTGAWGRGTNARYNNCINGSWVGEAIVPDSGDVTFTDVATSPSQDKVYFVWDANDEIWCNMGATGPPPPPQGNPVANFDFSPSGGPPPLEVTFDASASYDPNGTIVSYSWNFGDGGTGSGKIVSHTYTAAGTFSVKLTVMDNEDNPGSRTRTLEVIANNELPIVDFTFAPQSGLYPLEVTFTSTSTDPDGTIVEHSWQFGDGGQGSGQVVKHTYTRAGTFTIRLTVRDDRGATASKTAKIDIFSLFPPINVQWKTHADESLFQSRYITEVTWEKNPTNDELGVQIAVYRVFRKKTAEPASAYKLIGEVQGSVYRYLDKDVSGKDLYTYALTAVDSQGRQSPLSDSGGLLNLLKSLRESQRLNKVGGLNKRF